MKSIEAGWGEKYERPGTKPGDADGGVEECQTEVEITAEPVLAGAVRDRSQNVFSVPVPSGAKSPQIRGWQTLRLDEAELRTEFATADLNRGRLLGAASDGLVDCDLDAPEAVALAERFLPPTDEIHGRPGKVRSHYWYVVAEKTFKSTKYPDETGRMIVELRGDGAQTIVPPSRHTSGETYCWDRAGAPGKISTAELRAATGRLAAAVLVLRHYPQTGGRHEFVLALSLYCTCVDFSAACSSLRFAPVAIVARAGGTPVACIAYDSESGIYYVRFRYAGVSYKRSLKTQHRPEAEAVARRVAETLILLKRGRLELPPNADPAEFVLSDGKRNGNLSHTWYHYRGPVSCSIECVQEFGSSRKAS